jgi:hypothetical protein
MAVVSENSFRNLAPAQAAELSLLLDLEAGWQNLLHATSPLLETRAALQDLLGKQRAYETFHTKLVAYNKQFPPGHAPEPALNSPSRLGAWCRAIRNLHLGVERDPQSRCPVHLLAKAYRCADRIGIRMDQGLISRSTKTDTIGAVIQELDALIRWCDSLSVVSGAVAERSVAL